MASSFEALRRQGMRRLCAGVTQPNAASDAIHRAMGFQEVGVYTRIGWKHGRWHDVRWYELDFTRMTTARRPAADPRRLPRG